MFPPLHSADGPRLAPDAAAGGGAVAAVPPDPDEATLDLIAAKIKSGRCILFLGSGVHRPPGGGVPYVYPAEHSPPIGSRLAEILIAQGKLEARFKQLDVTEKPDDLMRIAQHYEQEFARHELVSAVRAACEEKKEPSPLVRALAKLDFPLVITTNYDRIFERALAAEDKKFTRSVYQRERKKSLDCPRPADGGFDLNPKEPFILKIHGDIEERSSIVITDEDYVHFVARMSDKEAHNPVPKNVRTLLLKWSTLFIGYSLKDYNLRLLFNTLRWKLDNADIPACYSIDFKPDPLISQVYQNQRSYVRFIRRNMWEVVPLPKNHRRGGARMNSPAPSAPVPKPPPPGEPYRGIESFRFLDSVIFPAREERGQAYSGIFAGIFGHIRGQTTIMRTAFR